MASTPFRTAVLLVAGLTLIATPSFAQRRNGGDGGRRAGGDGGGGERAQPRGRVERSEPRANEAPRPNAIVPRAAEPNRSADNRSNGNRAYDNRASGNRSYDNRSNGNRSYGNRPYDNRSFGNRAYDNRAYSRSYGGRPYVYPSYGARNRVYVAPYGYRPYGYRPGWSLNLYFGRPYGVYGSPAAGYGYYAIAPGRLYGSVRIVDAPPEAQVFVDGYYAGIVDDYDGVFQHLNLEVGSHHIEIEVDPGYPPIAFDVRIEPGQTVTYRANIQ